MAHREPTTDTVTVRVPPGLMIGVFFVCLFAFVLSFLSLRDLAVRAGAAPEWAWLMPLAMDVQTMVSTWAWLHPDLSHRVRDAARKITWIAIWLSILGNALDHVIIAIEDVQPEWMWFTSALVGAVAPAGMAMTVHLASLIITDRIEAVAKAAAAQARAAQKQAERATRATATATGGATPPATGSAPVNGHVNGHPVPPTVPDPVPSVRPTFEPRRQLETAAPDIDAAVASGTAPGTAVDKTALIERMINAFVAGGGDIHDRDAIKGSELAAKAAAQLGEDVSGQLGRKVLARARKAAGAPTSTGREVSS